MKIEKISDNQIRCTLTKEDLADRQLKLSELAYGTDKAKSLFRDMMQQAAFEFGFEANDIPLMIEAIPLSQDCIILIITKVEDPDELDTRFSKFSSSAAEEESENTPPAPVNTEGADDVLGLFKKIYEAKTNSSSKSTPSKSESHKPETNLYRLYTFDNLDSIIDAAHTLQDYFTGYSSLYKNSKAGLYTLVVSKSDHTPEDFNRICNILSEYGSHGKYSVAAEAYMKEHAETIIANDALQKLSQL